MNTELAFGWRPIEKGYSSGLDFLGLAAPVEGILDAETSGITNATARVRYFSLVPWYYWRYTQLGGEGSAADQRHFAIGFEMLLAYANIAWLESSGSAMSGIIRRDFCEKTWKEERATLPLRGDDVGDTPSPLDAALYGPSMRRLNLLGRYQQLHTCRSAGEVMAEELDKTFSQMESCDVLIDATTVDRTTVKDWADLLSLDLPTDRETELLRSLLFSDDEFAGEEIPPRVYTMLLLLNLSLTTQEPFTSSKIEVALVTGLDLSNNPFQAETVLSETYTRWRILAVLKFLRHASELAFAAIHTYVKNGSMHFPTAEAAAMDLMRLVFTMGNDANELPDDYAELVVRYEDGKSPPGWKPPNEVPAQVLSHAIAICAWCHAMLRVEADEDLLGNEMARVGQHLDADVDGYFEQLEGLLGQSVATALRWLCVDRAIARHFQVAARKLVQHDTFRLIEDEEGVRATDKCPIADVAIRVDSMLSLISDLKLLRRVDNGYVTVPETARWYEKQVERLTYYFLGQKAVLNR